MFVRVADYLINLDHVRSARFGRDEVALAVELPDDGVSSIPHTPRSVTFRGEDARRLRAFLLESLHFTDLSAGPDLRRPRMGALE